MRTYLQHPLSIALAFVLACWALLLPDGLDFVYWNQYYKKVATAQTQVASEAVIVSLDRGRENLVGSTARQADLLRQLSRQPARHIYFDFPLAAGMDPTSDAAFFKTAQAVGDRLDLVLRANHDSARSEGRLVPPAVAVPDDLRMVASVWAITFNGYAVEAPPAVQAGGVIYPSIVWHGTDQRVADRSVRIDNSIDPTSVPVIAASDILSGRTDQAGLAGKTVYVTATTADFVSLVGYFGRGRLPLVYADIAGARGAERGLPVDLGKLPLLGLFFAMMVIGNRLRTLWSKVPVYAAAVVFLLALPPILLEHRILVSNSLGLLAMLAYVPARIWQRWRRRLELTNGGSGLPNIDALVLAGIPKGFDVVAASIERFEEILSSLPSELHGECSRQIARRLSLASGDSHVYATDSGHFVWLDEPRPLETLAAHLEGLKALFSAPLVIGDHLLDTNIHFGIDRISTSAPVRRVQAAMASANEAQGKGKLYEEYEERRMAEAPWELSLYARIDEGLRNGDIWLALQPQLDIRTGRIMAAEALIRWNDPQRGMIPPDAFILQAERAGRIEAITYWVFERAIEYSEALNAVAPGFMISINLSARMADHPGLLERLRAIAARCSFDCSRMTIEVTETFSMTNRDVAKRNLLGLREMGFRLSIDDFGTGQASLAYLAEIPSDEIKLDKRFIQMVACERRERLIVRSVIKLAHALGQEVVAEGIEDEQTLAALRSMNCDIGQGYHIGRPERLEQMLDRVCASQDRKAG